MSDFLKAKVKAVNEANAYAVELYNKLVPIFTPLVGKKILKADDTILEKVKKLIPEMPNTVPLSVYRFGSQYSLIYVVKTCAMIDNSTCTYHDTSVYIGSLRNGELTGIADPPNMRTDYTVEEIENKRKAVDAAEKSFNDATNALGPFDRYNRN